MLAVALEEARTGRAEGGIPIGAALFTRDGELLGRGHNRRVQDDDPSVHGETDAFRGRGGGAPTGTRSWSPRSRRAGTARGSSRQFGISAVVIGESRTFAGGAAWLRDSGVDVIDLDSMTATSCARVHRRPSRGLGRGHRRMIGALAVSVALAACPAGTPAAMRLEGVPTTLVSGRSYTASLAATGVGEAVGNGWKLGVFDRLGPRLLRRPAGIGLPAGVQRRADGHAVHGVRDLRGAGLHADALGHGGGGAARASGR